MKDDGAEALGGVLAQLVEAAVRRAISEMVPAANDDADRLIDTEELTQRLGCSRGTVRRELGRGLPHVLVGDAKRFHWPTVLQWLAEREAS